MISEATVLDLFAGSGALGFESLSWGASRVVFVEESRQAAKLIEANARELGVLDRIELITDSVEHARGLLAKAGPFDLVLADPPYAGGWEMKLLETLNWSEILTENGLFCLEWGTQKSKVETLPDQVFLVAPEGSSEAAPAQLVKIREKNYGDSVLSTYAKRVT